MSAEPFLSDNKAEIVQRMWEAVREQAPYQILDALEKLGANREAHGVEEDPDALDMIRLSWCLGFYHCLRAMESGALKQMGKGQSRPENN